MAKEGFLDRQRRLIVHADFRGRETVLPGRHKSTSLDEYRRSGRGRQFFDRLWALVVVWFGLGWLVCGAALIGQPLGWLVDVGGAALGAAGAYLGLQYLAAWRCMRRHRTRPRREG